MLDRDGGVMRGARGPGIATRDLQNDFFSFFSLFLVFVGLSCYSYPRASISVVFLGKRPTEAPRLTVSFTSRPSWILRSIVPLRALVFVSVRVSFLRLQNPFSHSLVSSLSVRTRWWTSHTRVAPHTRNGFWPDSSHVHSFLTYVYTWPPWSSGLGRKLPRVRFLWPWKLIFSFFLFFFAFFLAFSFSGPCELFSLVCFWELGLESLGLALYTAAILDLLRSIASQHSLSLCGVCMFYTHLTWLFVPCPMCFALKIKGTRNSFYKVYDWRQSTLLLYFGYIRRNCKHSTFYSRPAAFLYFFPLESHAPSDLIYHIDLCHK